MIPRCWKRETVVVVASGPSLTPEDVYYCKGKARVAVINDNVRLASWADLLYAADYPWWKLYDGVPDFEGQKWTQDQRAAEEFDLNHTKGFWRNGISRDQNFIHYGRNSGFQCCNLVFLMGVKRILLLGFDMQKTDRKMHWFGNHPNTLHRQSEHGKWVVLMDKAAIYYEKAGVEVINCTRETALKKYERKPITDCL